MKDLTVKPTITIRDAMKALDRIAERCLLVVDENRKLLGTVTDGDLRRFILAGAEINGAIEKCFNRNPINIQEGNYDKKKAGELLVQHKVELIPILDEERRLVDYITWEQVFGGDGISLQKATITVPVVIMAGGKGTRLEPFTKVLPKPLVPIQDKPIIEHIIEHFTAVGVKDFWLTINYMSKILKAYFEEQRPDYSINFIDEKQPLGTAGSLKYLDGQFDQPFFMTNCDIIIDADYADLYKFHLSNGYDITLVASMKKYIIPYGTCELNGEGHLGHIKEKPEYDFLVNTGLYVLNPDVLSLIPDNQMYHFTELIKDAKKAGMKVGVYPISEERWTDIGQWVEYRKVLEKL